MGPGGSLDRRISVVDAEAGGQVYMRGQIAFSWEQYDEPCRRLAAVQLIEHGLAKTHPIATAFGVADQCTWRWRQVHAEAGMAGLRGEKKGPKRASKLTGQPVEDILARKAARWIEPAGGRRSRALGGQRAPDDETARPGRRARPTGAVPAARAG